MNTTWNAFHTQYLTSFSTCLFVSQKKAYTVYHFQPIRTPPALSELKFTNGVDGRTGDVDPNRIHKLIEECRTAEPPLVYGDARGSDVEREEFDQISCLHPRPLRQRLGHGDTNGAMLTESQGGEC